MDEFNKIRKEFNRSWDTVNKIVSMPENKIELRGRRPGLGFHTLKVETFRWDSTVKLFFLIFEKKSLVKNQAQYYSFKKAFP